MYPMFYNFIIRILKCIYLKILILKMITIMKRKTFKKDDMHCGLRDTDVKASDPLSFTFGGYVINHNLLFLYISFLILA